MRPASDLEAPREGSVCVAAARIFSRDFKVGVVNRKEAGENVSALSREIGVKREILYRWRDA